MKGIFNWLKMETDSDDQKILITPFLIQSSKFIILARKSEPSQFWRSTQNRNWVCILSNNFLTEYLLILIRKGSQPNSDICNPCVRVLMEEGGALLMEYALWGKFL